MAKSEKSSAESGRPVVAVDPGAGEFMHQAEDAAACVTARPATTCGCGLYALYWAELPSPDRA